ncbi:type II toxin-antitoxin system VapC family toxin [Diaminobutyricibacter tongyongensis]|uniref:Ribonuclease VapC n=1 Tax=Leifsonia tongyongensis TaxID=1268043 RepID=A0A6L9XTM3_9MICO|nr:type II toxin-antitoxin system VapC family toxin [Diaminobutyricibacter tongyongensis]NEN04625.1 type II toxin-antitoxin system VapC family toxin [Diaminobutyricibacter tongyongensis]
MRGAVVDSSALFDVLLHEGASGVNAHDQLRDRRLCAPELIAPELLSVARRIVRLDPALLPKAERLISEYNALNVSRFPHDDLLETAWEIRHTVSAYDAMYVTLARELDLPLLTKDRKLLNAARRLCEVELLA